MRARGTTLVEMLFTMVLVVSTIGATVTLYAFVALRSGDAITQYNVYRQTNDLMKSMSFIASNAISCQSVTLGSVTALECTMPDSGTDTDKDGLIDFYQPTGVYKTLQEYYSPGKRVWYFPSTSPVSVGTSGSFWYRAVRSDDKTITSDDIDKIWSYSTGSTPRYFVPGTVTFSHDLTNLNTVIQIAINTDVNPNTQVKGFSGNLSQKLPAVTLQRTCYWQGGK